MQRPGIDVFNPFQAQAETQPPATALSPIERLVATFAYHERRERESLQDYREAMKAHDNPLVKFLLQLVVADEEKHHEIIRTVAASLRADITWDNRLKSVVPALGKLTPADRAELLRLTDALIAEEKQGIADYRALAKESADYYGGLLELLIGTVIRDSEKHLLILRFLKKRLKAAA